VSRQWKLLYEKIAVHIVQSEGVHGDSLFEEDTYYEDDDDDEDDTVTDEGCDDITCTSTTTLASAAFASKQRASLAQECGLKLVKGSSTLQFIAGKYSDKQVLARLRELRLPFTARVACGAAAAGSLAKVKWLHREYKCELTSDVADYAAGSGNLALLKYLHSNECELGVDANYNAAAAGHIHVLEYLLQQCCPWNAEVCNAAAAGGHLEALRFLREHQCPLHAARIARHAAESGSIPLMEYVIEQGAALYSKVMLTAVQYGHVALCEQLLNELRCPFDVDACMSAALGGHAELLRSLYDAGSPWDAEDIDEICPAAAKGGSVDILDYLVNEARVVLSVDTLTDMLNIAGANEQLTAAQWCRLRGAEWPTVLQWYDEEEDNQVWTGATLAWARAEGCTAPTTRSEAQDDIDDNDDDDDDDDVEN
jgi:hypothetical protein